MPARVNWTGGIVSAVINVRAGGLNKLDLTGFHQACNDLHHKFCIVSAHQIFFNTAASVPASNPPRALSPGREAASWLASFWAERRCKCACPWGTFMPTVPLGGDVDGSDFSWWGDSTDNPAGWEMPLTICHNTAAFGSRHRSRVEERCAGMSRVEQWFD